jgi:CBS domain
VTIWPAVITSATSVRDAAQIMTRSHFRHLPVYDDSGLVGIVDICRALIDPDVSRSRPSGSGRLGAGAALVPDDGDRVPLGEPGSGRERLIEPFRAQRLPDLGHLSASPAVTRFVPQPRPSAEDLLELREPYDLPGPEYPDRWLPGPPRSVIVIAQLGGLHPDQPPSLAELLDTGRTRDPEPDLEAEP